MDEQFRPIKGYPGYRISRLGEVQSCWCRRGRLSSLSDNRRSLKPYNSRRYLKVKLAKNKRLDAFRIHRLVILAFVGPIPEGMVVAHKGGNPANNQQSNLRISTQFGNSLDARHHGTLRCGEDLPQAKLRATEVMDIRRLRSEGVKIGALAVRFGVSWEAIQAIVKGRTWKHLLPHDEAQPLDAEAVEIRGAA